MARFQQNKNTIALKWCYSKATEWETIFAKCIAYKGCYLIYTSTSQNPIVQKIIINEQMMHVLASFSSVLQIPERNYFKKKTFHSAYSFTDLQSRAIWKYFFWTCHEAGHHNKEHVAKQTCLLFCAQKTERHKGTKDRPLQGMPPVHFSPASRPYFLVSTTPKYAIKLWIFNCVNPQIKSPMAWPNHISPNSTFQNYYIGIQATHENLRGHLIGRPSENEQTFH